MDIVDSSGFWSSTSGTPAPPPPPKPSDGDGVMLVANFNQYERLYPRREPANPWVDLLAFWRGLREREARWVMPAMARQIEQDDQEIMDLTQLTRRR